MKQDIDIKWREEPSEHDYPAAKEYLSLMFQDKDAKTIAKYLKKQDVSFFYAKDIFRACGLPELDKSNGHVRRVLEKIATGEAISPLLLVKDCFYRRVIVADGYHRLCAVHTFDEDSRIPCKIIEIGKPSD